jgi:hypothetical protein
MTGPDQTDLRHDDLECDLARYLDALADDLRARAGSPGASAPLGGSAPPVDDEAVVDLETYTADRPRRGDEDAPNERAARGRRALWLVAAAVLLIGALAAVAVRATQDDSNSLPIAGDPPTSPEACGGGYLTGTVLVGPDVCIGTYGTVDAELQFVFATTADGKQTFRSWVHDGCLRAWQGAGAEGAGGSIPLVETSSVVSAVRYRHTSASAALAPTEVIPGVGQSRIAALLDFDASVPPEISFLDAEGQVLAPEIGRPSECEIEISNAQIEAVARDVIGRTSAELGAQVGGPCPTTDAVVDPVHGTWPQLSPPPGHAIPVSDGDRDNGSCQVIAWQVRSIPGMPGPFLYADQGGTILGDARTPKDELRARLDAPPSEADDRRARLSCPPGEAGPAFIDTSGFTSPENALEALTTSLEGIAYESASDGRWIEIESASGLVRWEFHTDDEVVAVASGRENEGRWFLDDIWNCRLP